MINVQELLIREIEACTKANKGINLQLVKEDGVYKTTLPFKLEGDFMLSANDGAIEAVVQVETTDENVVFVSGLDEEQMVLHATLTKDEAQILKAVQSKLEGNEEFSSEPSFIVGPPGTGKTSVIIKIIEEAIKQGDKILIASPTNMAVSNVFEKLDTEAMGLGDDEVVLTIRTDELKLKKYSSKEIVRHKIAPLEDELEVLSYAQNEIFEAKRTKEADLYKLTSSEDSMAIKINGLEKEISKIDAKYSVAKEDLSQTLNRIKMLTGNAFVASVAGAFMSSKLDDLNEKKVQDEKRVQKYQVELDEHKIKLASLKYEENKEEDQINSLNSEIDELREQLNKVTKRIDEIKKEIEELKNEDVYKNARIVGATTISAALNAKIQNGEFTKIIIDEASMALVPVLVASCKALKPKEKEENKKEIKWKDETVEDIDAGIYKLNSTQERAVELGLNKEIILVGDPIQLSPIAKTFEMKKSVFEWYHVDKIFEGLDVPNTVLLDINFRCHADITNTASRLFYGGLLKSGKKHNGKRSIFIRHSRSVMYPHQDGSYVNYGNAEIVMQQVKLALEKGQREIGVITPFRKQAELIEESFASLLEAYPEYMDASFKAGTIHKFQGQERDIIIFDVTYSPATEKDRIPVIYSGNAKSETARLLNVAMTRAKNFFVVVGNVSMLRHMENNNLAIKSWSQAICDLAKTK